MRRTRHSKTAGAEEASLQLMISRDLVKKQAKEAKLEGLYGKEEYGKRGIHHVQHIYLTGYSQKVRRGHV